MPGSPSVNFIPVVDRPILGVMLAGYDHAGIGKLISIEFPSLRKQVEVFTTRKTGASWHGETDVISRLIKGWDPRVVQLNAIQGLGEGPRFLANFQLNLLQYNIPFDAMMMQDGVDFALALVRITSDMQRFAHGTIGNSTDIPGVGGAVDVLVVNPFGLQWVKRKTLSAN